MGELSHCKDSFSVVSDADIAVLDTGQNQTQAFNIQPEGSSSGMTFGQQIWFLGYPFIEGLGSHFAQSSAANDASKAITELPFIKRGTISAVDNRNPDAVVLYVDGFNNQGFSGGPILYWSFVDHVYKIAGVVQGYKNDTAKAMINGQQVEKICWLTPEF